MDNPSDKSSLDAQSPTRQESPSANDSHFNAEPRERFVPFEGWAPLTSAADIERLIIARGNQFSEDGSFED